MMIQEVYTPSVTNQLMIAPDYVRVAVDESLLVVVVTR